MFEEFMNMKIGTEVHTIRIESNGILWPVPKKNTEKIGSVTHMEVMSGSINIYMEVDSTMNPKSYENYGSVYLAGKHYNILLNNTVIRQMIVRPVVSDVFYDWKTGKRATRTTQKGIILLEVTYYDITVSPVKRDL